MMKPGAVGQVILAAASLGAGPAAADVDLSPGIWFSGTAGVGTPRIEHPELGTKLRPGGYMVLAFGATLSSSWQVGGEFTTWETSPLGTPVHLHTIGPRIEYLPRGPGGVFARGTLGMALTEGKVEARAGGAAAIALGHRWMLASWIGLAVEAGAHGQAYGNGSAVIPFLAVDLRFFGLIPR